MGAGNGNTDFPTSEFSQHLRTLFDGNPFGTEVLIFGRLNGYSRRVNNKVYIQRYLLRVVNIVHGYPFGFKLPGKGRRRTVVTSDVVAPLLEVTRQCTHSYASYAEKVVVHVFLLFVLCLVLLR